MEDIVADVSVSVCIYGENEEYARSLSRVIGVAIEKFGEETANSIEHEYHFEDSDDNETTIEEEYI